MYADFLDQAVAAFVHAGGKLGEAFGAEAGGDQRKIFPPIARYDLFRRKPRIASGDPHAWRTRLARSVRSYGSRQMDEGLSKLNGIVMVFKRCRGRVTA